MLIVANWKAYVDQAERAKRLAQTGKRLARGKHTIVLAPSAPHLGLFKKAGRGKFQFASQDVSLIKGGAATGEVVASLLRDLGITYVIVGHSERRAGGETDAVVAKKVQAALGAGLIPVLCIGERMRDPEAHYLKDLRAQLTAVFEALPPKDRLKVVIAYEPIWAIGKSALEAITPSDLAEMVLYIRKVLAQYVAARSASKVRVLYGGSVEPSNIGELARGGHVDGFLIGHASVDVKDFAALVKELS
jgi:triosephosphate isomerase (TIM)